MCASEEMLAQLGRRLACDDQSSSSVGSSGAGEPAECLYRVFESIDLSRNGRSARERGHPRALRPSTLSLVARSPIWKGGVSIFHFSVLCAEPRGPEIRSALCTFTRYRACLGQSL